MRGRTAELRAKLTDGGLRALQRGADDRAGRYGAQRQAMPYCASGRLWQGRRDAVDARAPLGEWAPIAGASRTWTQTLRGAVVTVTARCTRDTSRTFEDESFGHYTDHRQPGAVDTWGGAGDVGGDGDRRWFNFGFPGLMFADLVRTMRFHGVARGVAVQAAAADRAFKARRGILRRSGRVSFLRLEVDVDDAQGGELARYEMGASSDEGTAEGASARWHCAREVVRLACFAAGKRIRRQRGA